MQFKFDINSKYIFIFLADCRGFTKKTIDYNETHCDIVNSFFLLFLMAVFSKKTTKNSIPVTKNIAFEVTLLLQRHHILTKKTRHPTTLLRRNQKTIKDKKKSL